MKPCLSSCVFVTVLQWQWRSVWGLWQHPGGQLHPRQVGRRGTPWKTAIGEAAEFQDSGTLRRLGGPVVWGAPHWLHVPWAGGQSVWGPTTQSAAVSGANPGSGKEKQTAGQNWKLSTSSQRGCRSRWNQETQQGQEERSRPSEEDHAWECRHACRRFTHRGAERGGRFGGDQRCHAGHGNHICWDQRPWTFLRTPQQSQRADVQAERNPEFIRWERCSSGECLCRNWDTHRAITVPGWNPDSTLSFHIHLHQIYEFPESSCWCWLFHQFFSPYSKLEDSRMFCCSTELHVSCLYRITCPPSAQLRLFVRLAGNLSEPGLCSAEEEPDLLTSHQRREDSGGRDPHPQRAAVQEEGLFVHLTVHIAGAGEGTQTNRQTRV